MIKKYLNRLFIDGLSGMASGLFATLIIGTIISQIGAIIGGAAGGYLVAVGGFAKTITGAGIGIGVACKLKSSPLVTVSAAVAGLVGAFPNIATESFVLGRPGEPLGAFVALMCQYLVKQGLTPCFHDKMPPQSLSYYSNNLQLQRLRQDPKA